MLLAEHYLLDIVTTSVLVGQTVGQACFQNKSDISYFILAVQYEWAISGEYVKYLT